MKLKNLFTCTVTGLLLCTSCIKDEAPNAEADILSCILPAEMPVSYTHLDVYKRQASACAKLAFAESNWSTAL